MFQLSSARFGRSVLTAYLLARWQGLERFRSAYLCVKDVGVGDDEQMLSEKIAQLMGNSSEPRGQSGSMHDSCMIFHFPIY